MLSYSEVEARNEGFTASIRAIKTALDCAEKLPEYLEMNAISMELREAMDNIKTRLLAHAKTSDKNMMIRIHQMDAITSR